MAIVKGRTMAMVAIFAVLCVYNSAQGAVGGKYHSIVYYVHESWAEPNRTVVTIAGQNASSTVPTLGATNAFDNPIQVSADQYSEVVGYAAGIAITSSHPNVITATTTHTLNSTTLGVGTIVYSGKIDFNVPLKPSEVVVVGGTGAFQLLRGIAIIEAVYFGFPYNTYQYNVTLVR